jgi:hypothetical protein
VNITNTLWRFPALLAGHSDGTWQATRAGRHDEIRAGLRALLAQDWPSGQRRSRTTPDGEREAAGAFPLTAEATR